MSDLVPWLAPYSGWAILLALAICGATIAAWALFSDRARGRRRCPRCAYDLSHSPTPTCSECGHTLRRDRDAFRTRRRWRVAACGLLVAIALPTFVVQRRVRQFGWPYYTYVGPLYWVLPDRTLGTWAIGDATLRISVDRRREQFQWQPSGRRATLTRGWHTLWSIEDDDVEAGLPRLVGPTAEWPRDDARVGPAVDVDGDGQPECVVRGLANGTGHFTRTFILKLHGDLVTNLTPGASLDGSRDGDGMGEVIGAADLRGEGAVDLIVCDETLAYWHTSNAGSPRPWVAMKRAGSGYVASPELMRRRLLAPTTRAIGDATLECRAIAWPRPARPYDLDDDLYAPLLSTMTGLIYAGRSAEAYAFLDDAWPGDAASKGRFIAEFRAKLATSPYRDALVALGHPPFDAR